MVEEEQRHRHKMAETEQQNLHEFNLRLLKDRTMRFVVGRIMSGSIALVLTVGGGGLILMNKPWQGFVLLAGEVGIILYGPKAQEPKVKK